MAKILLLSGPNLNLLGEREPAQYGTTTLAELVALAQETAAKLGHGVEHVQSNHEGDLIDAIHGARDMFERDAHVRPPASRSGRSTWA